VPLEDAYKFSFSYRYNVPQEELRSAANLWQASAFAGSNLDTHTIIKDAKGKVMKRVPPTNEHIELTLREVLSYTGRPNWLEEEQGELGANKFANAKHRTGPVGRLSGLEIDMVMECHNSLASGGSWNFALKKSTNMYHTGNGTITKLGQENIAHTYYTLSHIPWCQSES